VITNVTEASVTHPEVLPAKGEADFAHYDSLALKHALPLPPLPRDEQPLGSEETRMLTLRIVRGATEVDLGKLVNRGVLPFAPFATLFVVPPHCVKCSTNSRGGCSADDLAICGTQCNGKWVPGQVTCYQVQQISSICLRLRPNAATSAKWELDTSRCVLIALLRFFIVLTMRASLCVVQRRHG
jgi:hypothetical protein